MMPGTIDPNSHIPHVKSTSKTVLAAPARTGFAAIPVRNIAAVMRFACAPKRDIYSPALSGLSSGKDPRASASERFGRLGCRDSFSVDLFLQYVCVFHAHRSHIRVSSGVFQCGSRHWRACLTHDRSAGLLF